MTDIIVTTPKSRMADSAQEAADCIKNGGGSYVRILTSTPKELNERDRVWYVEDGYIRGFAEVYEIIRWQHPGHFVRCDTTGKDWRVPPKGCMVFLDSKTWTWIKPIPLRGFQGYRYLPPRTQQGYIKMGGWLDPKPENPV